MTSIQTRAEIITALKDSQQRAQNWFSAIPTTDFFTRQGEAWSASDNIDHMIRAIKPIAKALKLPKIALQTMFGKPENLSRSYDEICKIYGEEIARGAKAGGSFLPDQATPEHPQDRKTELLDQLSSMMDKLLAAIESWEDIHLDNAQLPHPIIGKLTIREMLFFTIHHNLRHASQEGD